MLPLSGLCTMLSSLKPDWTQPSSVPRYGADKPRYGADKEDLARDPQYRKAFALKPKRSVTSGTRQHRAYYLPPLPRNARNALFTILCKIDINAASKRGRSSTGIAARPPGPPCPAWLGNCTFRPRRLRPHARMAQTAPKQQFVPQLR